MFGNLANSILKVCGPLNKHHVQYMVVGGSAVAFHGYDRQSMSMSGVLADKPDLDFWYNPTYENYFNLLKALADLGKDVQQYEDEQAPNPKKSFFKYEFEDFTLDLLPELKAQLKFSASYQKREVVSIGDIDIPFIGFEDLIQDKQATARAKDLIDIEQLMKNKKEEEGA